jgi:hypothetical protein
MELYAYTSEDARVFIELVGEDGRVISRQVIDGARPGRQLWLAPELPFEIEAAAETARLQVSVRDGAGRLETLSSVDLVLLSVGRNEINPQAVTQEPFLIRRPKDDAVANGGVLVLEALARPVNESPLIIELINEYGTVLYIKQLIVPTPAGELSHTPFTLEIPYSVKTTTPVRLVIRQEGSRIPGPVALVSVPVVLEP